MRSKLPRVLCRSLLQDLLVPESLDRIEGWSLALEMAADAQESVERQPAADGQSNMPIEEHSMVIGSN